MTKDLVDFPVRDFIEHGLLHHVNSTALWPLGLTLTAHAWANEGEMYRDAIQPRIRAALDAPAVRDALVQAVMFSDLDSVPSLLDALAAAVFDAMASDMQGGAIEGLRLRQYDPPAVMVSALTAAEQAQRRAKAARWIVEREYADHMTDAPEDA